MPYRQVMESAGVAAKWEAIPPLIGWTKGVVGNQVVEKVFVGLFAGLATQLPSHYEALGMVLYFWLLDFVLGVVRAVSDPDVDMDPRRAAVGTLKPFVILIVWGAAAGFEWAFQVASPGWELGGKFVLLVCLAMVWEESVSIRRNGTFFYRRIKGLFDRAETGLLGVIGKEKGEDEDEED